MLVTLHVWRVRRRALGAAWLRMATEPRRVRALPGVRFAKLLGTGRGDTFTPRDADPTRFAAIVVWDRPAPAAGADLAFPVGDVDRPWPAGDADPSWPVDEIDRPWPAGDADPSWPVDEIDRPWPAGARLDLEPLASRGRWSGREPFSPTGRTTAGPVVALTRARLRPSRMLAFWRASGPVAAAVAGAPGLLARFGIGEAPVGWQGTISVWRGVPELTAFAYRQPEHRAVVARTPAARWYAEELFARFAVLGVSGDKAVLGWQDEEQPYR